MSFHYDSFPYPDPRSYLVKAPLRYWKTDNGPREDTWEGWFPGQEHGRKRVLVVGCGTTEAVIIAAQNPFVDVVGIDVSPSSVATARNLAAKEGISNVELVNGDFLDVPMPEECYDAAICSGVLHHIRYPEPFVRRMRAWCRAGARACVMVYGDIVRSFLPAFCQALRSMNVRPDYEGVAVVRGIIALMPDYHPVRAFFETTDRSDAQIADLFLHPYFRQYAADDFVRLMQDNGFAFVRWMNKAIMVPPELSDRLSGLNQLQRWRIGQVFNHADAKLTAMFEAT